MTNGKPTVVEQASFGGRERIYEPGKYSIQLRIRQDRQLDQRAYIVAKAWIRRFGHRHGYLLGTPEISIVRSRRDPFGPSTKDDGPWVLRILCNMIVDPKINTPRVLDRPEWIVDLIDRGQRFRVPIPSDLGVLLTV